MDFEASLESLIQKWEVACSERKPLALRVPLSTYLNEANELAALMDRHVDPVQEQGKSYPGLSCAFDEQTLNWDTPGEIRELVYVVSDLQARATSKRLSRSNVRIEEARRVRSEWMAGLRLLFQQANHKQGQQELKRLRTLFKDQSQDGVARSLHAVLELAREHLDGLRRLGLDDDSLKSAQTTETELLRHSAHLEQRQAERASALHIRNQLVGLLDEKVQAGRQAIRFVFRDHDDILERAQSRYEKMRRRKHAAKKRNATA